MPYKIYKNYKLVLLPEVFLSAKLQLFPIHLCRIVIIIMSFRPVFSVKLVRYARFQVLPVWVL